MKISPKCNYFQCIVFDISKKLASQFRKYQFVATHQYAYALNGFIDKVRYRQLGMKKVIVQGKQVSNEIQDVLVISPTTIANNCYSCVFEQICSGFWERF